jgi:nucleotide-binding universal stress UspA family protein
MKTILVYLEGTEADESVLAAGSAVGRHFGAHLACLRIQPDALAMIRYFGDFATAPAAAIGEAVHAMQQDTHHRTARVETEFLSFCKTHDIARVDDPRDVHHMTAALARRDGDELAILTYESRFRDVTVLAGGPRGKLPLSVEDLGSLLIDGGRPLLLVPPGSSCTNFRKIGIAWKTKPESARAITAAMPLLEKAQTVLVFGASENGEDPIPAMAAVVEQLRWHGINAETRALPHGTAKTVADTLLSAATDAERDLLVMGGYGHSRVREVIFGGVTEHVLRGAPLPVLMAH